MPIFMHVQPRVNSDVRLYWSKSEGRREISFNDTPFSVKETKVLDCQFGHKYYKQKPKQGEKMWLQGTRKKGCMAHIEVKTFTLYPHYAISEHEKKGLSKWKLRCLKEEKLKELQSMLHAQTPVTTEVKYFVSFPSIEAHCGHPIGQEAVYTQKLHPQVAQKITEMVTSGITDTAEVRRSLKYYVDNFLCKDIDKNHTHMIEHSTLSNKTS